MENIQNLLSEIRRHVELDNKQKEEARKRGENFNVFSVLRMETAEMETHSAFLASLLNPDGDHGMNDTFLKSFVNNVFRDKPGQERFDLNTSQCAVQVEHFTGDGRIDILIADNTAHKAIVIENKIYAGDQNAQMKRYYDYAAVNYAGGFRLLYLTLDGHEPSDDSRKDLKDVDFVCISYQSTILPWLEQCAKDAYNKPLVRETINQYISLIKNLTGMGNDHFKESLNVLTSEEFVGTTLDILENSGNIQCRIRELFVQKIQQECKQLGLECTFDEGIIKVSDNSWITISRPQNKNVEFKIGVFKHTNKDGFRMYISVRQGNVKRVKFWDEGNDPTDDFPLGWIYLWSETGKPGSGHWWRWDEWPTLRDMTNGKMLNFIMSQIHRMMNQQLF